MLRLSHQFQKTMKDSEIRVCINISGVAKQVESFDLFLGVKLGQKLLSMTVIKGVSM